MISYPQTMPTGGIVSQKFEPRPNESQYLSPENGGRLGAITAGETLWGMTLNYGAMKFAVADRLRAFLAGQRGPQRSFLAFDKDRRVPFFYQTGRPYQSTPSAWAQTITADATAYLTLSGLQPGQVVSIGDYVGFAWGGGAKLALVRSLELQIADLAGSVAFAIEPAVPMVVPAGAATTLREARCLMRLIPGQSNVGEQVLGYVEAGGSMTAVQDLVA